jgi:hypothetical protein
MDTQAKIDIQASGISSLEKVTQSIAQDLSKLKEEGVLRREPRASDFPNGANSPTVSRPSSRLSGVPVPLISPGDRLDPARAQEYQQVQ